MQTTIAIILMVPMGVVYLYMTSYMVSHVFSHAGIRAFLGSWLLAGFGLMLMI